MKVRQEREAGAGGESCYAHVHCARSSRGRQLIQPTGQSNLSAYHFTTVGFSVLSLAHGASTIRHCPCLRLHNLRSNWRLLGMLG
jgi:hypothetical protein